MSKEIISVFPINFWSHFDLRDSFLGYLLRTTFGQFELAASEEVADIVFSSTYMTSNRCNPKFNHKTIWLIWENLRPVFDLAHYAISCDFDDYGGRNVRCPVWYGELKWPGYERPSFVSNPSNHGYEPLVEIESILQERTHKADADRRQRFCCFVAGRQQHHRTLAVELLSQIEKVDVFGNVSGVPLKQSKYTILPNYKFNLCFENSMFPGYYTEKPVQAWQGGCVPLYFADRFAGLDFNPAALLNRADFPSISDFIERVRKINSSPDAVKEIVSQPLVLKEPSLDSIFSFLKETYAKIRRDSRPSVAVSAQNSVSSTFVPDEKWFSPSRRNALCPCGSGKKYKHCHGAVTTNSSTVVALPHEPAPPVNWCAKPMNSQSGRVGLTRQLISRCKIGRIIETGTYMGATTEFFAQFNVPVFTAESDPENARFARARLTNCKNVDLRVGDLVRVLEEILRETIDRTIPTLFYLDAHWGIRIPLREEAELAIANFANAVLMIDDFAVPDDPGYGFDDYGPGRKLNIDYLLASKLPALSIFFPSTPAFREDGARRGCVVATANPALAAILDDIALLRRWKTTPAAVRPGQNT